MNENTIMPHNLKFLKYLRGVLVCLLIFDVGLFAYALPPYLRGETDMYPNQHLGLVMGAVGQIFLALGMLVGNSAQLSTKHSSIKYVISLALLICAIVLVIYQFRLL